METQLAQSVLHVLPLDCNSASPLPLWPQKSKPPASGREGKCLSAMQKQLDKPRETSRKMGLQSTAWDALRAPLRNTKLHKLLCCLNSFFPEPEFGLCCSYV